MVNGPEAWSRPGWMKNNDGLTHGWLFSAVLFAYLLVYRKNSGIIPEKLRKISHILFFRISYNPTLMW